MFVNKINSIHFGGKMIMISVILGVVIPGIIWLITGYFTWFFCIPGGLVLLCFFILFSVEMKQDNGKVPYYEAHLKETIPFDPENQTAIIRSSICTGEKIAGFRDKRTGHFTEVMVIRSEEEKMRFMKIYELDSVSTEY